MVLVTGASKGIGRAAALAFAFAKEGDDLAICARGRELIEETGALLAKMGARVVTGAVVISKQDQVEAFVARVAESLGRIDVLVNNAASSTAATFFQSTNEDWQKQFDVSVLGMVNCCRAVIPHMQKQRWGRIVNLSTRQAIKPSVPMYIRYSAIKASVGNLSKTLATALAKDGILVNCISPGFIETPIHTDPHALLDQMAAAVGKTREELVEGAASKIPLGRLGTPEEVAAAILFFSSDKASYITGANLIIDGGAREGWA